MLWTNLPGFAERRRLAGLWQLLDSRESGPRTRSSENRTPQLSKPESQRPVGTGGGSVHSWVRGSAPRPYVQRPSPCLPGLSEPGAAPEVTDRMRPSVQGPLTPSRGWVCCLCSAKSGRTGLRGSKQQGVYCKVTGTELSQEKGPRAGQPVGEFGPVPFRSQEFPLSHLLPVHALLTITDWCPVSRRLL